VQRAERLVNDLEGREMPDELPENFEDTLAHERHTYTNYDDLLYELFDADDIQSICAHVWETETGKQLCVDITGSDSLDNVVVDCPVRDEAHGILKRAANKLVGELDSQWHRRRRMRESDLP